MNHWWNHTVFYQIYMPSFCDGNNDGIGDFVGIRSKLPYLKQLGVGCIWLTPFYPRPRWTRAMTFRTTATSTPTTARWRISAPSSGKPTPWASGCWPMWS